MTVKSKPIIENEKLLVTISKRQTKLAALTSYLSDLEHQLTSIFTEAPDAIVFIDKDSQVINIGTKQQQIQKIGLIQLKKAS